MIKKILTPSELAWEKEKKNKALARKREKRLEKVLIANARAFSLRRWI